MHNFGETSVNKMQAEQSAARDGKHLGGFSNSVLRNKSGGVPKLIEPYVCRP